MDKYKLTLRFPKEVEDSLVHLDLRRFDLPNGMIFNTIENMKLYSDYRNTVSIIINEYQLAMFAMHNTNRGKPRTFKVTNIEKFPEGNIIDVSDVGV